VSPTSVSRRECGHSKDIGVRVEDSFLLTDDGLERLSATVPRTVEETESFMAADRVQAVRDSH
jgi:hypothetical protein